LDMSARCEISPEVEDTDKRNKSSVPKQPRLLQPLADMLLSEGAVNQDQIRGKDQQKEAVLVTNIEKNRGICGCSHDSHTAQTRDTSDGARARSLRAGFDVIISMLSQDPVQQNLLSFIQRVFVLLLGRVLHRVFEPLCKIWRMGRWSGPNHEHSRI
jgi:hypothetical protein